ncbi:GPI2-domain-containing protein [Mollisia scopiformis]|uniref:GPI2-domain-containing protein n=1 Tax=Mollisia scopiformis TaxID=149040 RepID=A0A194X2Q5_MOLSC|nr:GPI2-domain-containing protein [Mollisia scopiformis]KUJ14304.1 GPI2-domain-containing protein [Mollisia scopiformis]
MVPNQAPPTTTTVTEPLPPLTRSTTLPAYTPRPITTDRSLLTPEDAIYQGSPPRRLTEARVSNGSSATARLPRERHTVRNRSGSRRRKGVWKKLLWVKQSSTFLEHLQRNPRLQPYDFWPLVADSTVIVQHVCSVIIFIVCFVGIYQERISPGAVVRWGSVGTLVGWGLWDWWVGQEDPKPSPPILTQQASASSSVSNLNIPPNGLARHSHSTSASSIHSTASTQVPTPRTLPNHPAPNSNPLSARTSLRLSTAKSALLIYFTLLGLSPILKSLTWSTSEDSIWAMSFLLFTINIFFFDYGTPALSSSSMKAGIKNIPASLSTNAALMASTVLASRLPSTGQVFSLTLFSIEVFGLFPVFRRYARQRTWRGHVALTTVLVLGAGGGIGTILGRGGDGEGIWDWPWKSGLMGLVIGVVITGLAMGGCSWWLIGLQKYKNEIHGPWDPARPIIRRHWEEY